MKNDFEIASPLVLLKDDALFITKLTRKLTTGNNTSTDNFMQHKGRYVVLNQYATLNVGLSSGLVLR